MNQTIKEKLKLLPDLPGSYQMKDKDGTIIYVGKAKNLKNRVRSYFHGVHNAKTTKLVSLIEDFDYVITKSELEALVLEINLIKEYNPKYNIMLTDDKTYPYIALTNELYPRLIVTRNRKLKARYFGPYPNVYEARVTLNLLNRIYPFRKCAHIPKKECLYYHMKQCLGPCINDNLDYQEYRAKAASFLNGNTDEIIKKLNSDMEEASNNLEFEKAIEIRNLIEAINKVSLKQKISINDSTNRDYIGIYLDDDSISINIIITRLGNIVQNHQTIIDRYEDFEGQIINYLYQFYDLNTKPKEFSIIGFDKYNELEELLDITFVSCQIGKKKEILDMALYNAKFNLENKRNIYKNQVLKKLDAIEELGNLLHMDAPERIEAFDNSNLFGEYPVSAMVCYINGRPAPKEYRKYHVKTVVGANDYATMKEIIYRRYFRLVMENDKLPDLIIMDGGQIQVNAAKEVIESLNLAIPICGIQKDDHHKATILYYENEFINIDKNSKVFLLLADISQKVHDFAISFFRSTKAKGFFTSQLDGIEGLGKVGKEKLLKYFINIDGIKKASVEELVKSGINKTTAINVFNKFHE